jgi:hypothetical protein
MKKNLYVFVEVRATSAVEILWRKFMVACPGQHRAETNPRFQDFRFPLHAAGLHILPN